VQEEAHIPGRRPKRKYCDWRGCRPALYNRRKPLQEVRNNARPVYTSKTQDYCERCMKSLCIGKGCWAAYHKDNGLQIRPEDDVVGGGAAQA
jgi:hypothetical protein